MHYGSDRPPVMRNQSFVTVTGSSGVLLGPNPRRIGLIVSAPQQLLDANANNVTEASGVDVGSAAGLLAINASAPSPWVLRSLSIVEHPGSAAQFVVQLVHGVDTPQLARITGSGNLACPLYFGAGDHLVVSIDVTEGASVADAVATWTQLQQTSRITLSLQGAAVIDKGITLYAGAAPLLLLYQDIGAAFQEQINAVADAGSQTIGVVELLSA